MHFEVGEFGDDFPLRVGIDCGRKQGDKGFVTVEECLSCPGVDSDFGYIRCYPRQYLLTFLRKQTSEYYGAKWGIYHVSDINMCTSNFLFGRYCAKVFSTQSLWNMRFGTEIHSWYNEGEISRPIIEQSVSNTFEANGRKVSIVGSQDAVFEELDLNLFTDVKHRIFNDAVLKYAFGPHLDGDRALRGVLCDRKSTISLKSVLSAPKEYHINQLVKYTVLREEKDVSCIMITYLDKFGGRELNHIVPVIYTDSPQYKDVGEDVLSRSVVINKAAILEACRNKASAMETFLASMNMPLRMPAFKQECAWCPYKQACQHTPNTPIMDSTTLDIKVDTWCKMLRVSDKFDDEFYSVENTIERWTDEVFEGEGQGDEKLK